MYHQSGVILELHLSLLCSCGDPGQIYFLPLSRKAHRPVRVLTWLTDMQPRSSNDMLDCVHLWCINSQNICPLRIVAQLLWTSGWASELTFSTDAFMMYRMMHTRLSCPRRWTRPLAWLSIDGFHCGSRKCTRLATERSLRLQVTRCEQTSDAGTKSATLELIGTNSPNCTSPKGH